MASADGRNLKSRSAPQHLPWNAGKVGVAAASRVAWSVRVGMGADGRGNPAAGGSADKADHPEDRDTAVNAAPRNTVIDPRAV